jgi:hypothetical protein
MTYRISGDGKAETDLIDTSHNFSREESGNLGPTFEAT